MKGLITITAQLILAGQRAYLKKWSFLCVFLLVFSGSVATLSRLDFLPSAKSDLALSVLSATAATANTPKPMIPELPARIEIQAINLSAAIANPTTVDIATLDEYLLNGAVRYPTSAKLGEEGNVVLFGHSSYLPVVNNQAYKTFNGIQKLVAGDMITVSSSNTAYIYKVKSMKKESTNDAVIPLEVEGKILTLSTCNSFADKNDRFVVVAEFVESHPVR